MAQEAVGLTFWKPVFLKSVHPANFFFFRIWFLIFAFSYSWTSGGELGDCKVLFEGVDDGMIRMFRMIRMIGMIRMIRTIEMVSPC